MITTAGIRTNQSIAVAIVTCNRNKELSTLLKSLSEVIENWPGVRVLVIDSGTRMSFMSNARLISSLEFNVVHVSSPRNKTKQMNLAVSLVDEEFVLFLDDDVILHHDYLKAIMPCFRDSNVVGATGYVVNQKKYNLCEAAFRKLFLLQDINHKATRRKMSGYFSFLARPSGIEDALTLWGCNMVIRRSALENCCFDERLTNFIDLGMSLCLRKQGTLKIVEHARLVHNRSAVSRTSAWRVIARQAACNYRIFNKQENSPLAYCALIWSMIGSIILASISFLLLVDLTKGTFRPQETGRSW